MPTDRRPSCVRRAATAAALTLAVATGLVAGSGLAAAAPPTTRVTNADLGPASDNCNTATPTGYCTELHVGGTAAVVDDKRANLGHGYLRLSTPGASDHATVFAQKQFGGKKLADLDNLAFETLIEQAGTNPQVAPSINIQINPNKADSKFTSLVWEPIYAGTPVVTGTWQTWTPSTSPGGWWATGAPSAGGTPNKYGFNSYTAKFAQVKAALPDATIYQIGVNQGTGSPGLIAGVDQLRLNDTTYDFDNGPPSADLSIALSTRGTARPGSQITVTITVTNAGRSPASKIDTSIVFPRGLRVLTAQGGLGIGSVATFRTPELGAGKPVALVVTLAVDATARGSLTMFAATHSAVIDPNAANNVATATVPATV